MSEEAIYRREEFEILSPDSTEALELELKRRSDQNELRNVVVKINGAGSFTFPSCVEIEHIAFLMDGDNFIVLSPRFKKKEDSPECREREQIYWIATDNFAFAR